MPGLIIAVVVILVIAGILVFIGLKNPKAQSDDVLLERLEEFSQTCQLFDLEKL